MIRTLIEAAMVIGRKGPAREDKMVGAVTVSACVI